MTTNPTAPQDGGEKLAQIDRAAQFLRETQQAGKRLTPWDGTPKATKKKWQTLAEGALNAAQIDFAAVHNEALEEAVTAARDAMVAHEWPPQDGDIQIDEVLAAIRALQQKGPSNG